MGSVGTGGGLGEQGAFPGQSGEERGVKPEGIWASSDSKVKFKTQPKGRWGPPGYTKSSLGEYRAGAIRRNVSCR